MLVTHLLLSHICGVSDPRFSEILVSAGVPGCEHKISYVLIKSMLVKGGYGGQWYKWGLFGIRTDCVEI